MNDDTRPVFNIAELPEVTEREGEWAAAWKVLTPNMRARGGSLGVNYVQAVQRLSQLTRENASLRKR